MASPAHRRGTGGRSLKEQVCALPPEVQAEYLSGLPVEVLAEIIRDEWWWTARPEQVPPPGEWLIYLVLSGRGWGKALDVDTPVPTPSGWTTMGELRPGDHVISGTGVPTRISWVSPVQINRTCYRITFSDGAEVVADAEHQWAATSRADRRGGRGYRTVTTEQMLQGGVKICSGRESNWQMPAAPVVDLPEVELPVDPYVLGFWLGDGSSVGGTFTIGDKDAGNMLKLFADRGLVLEYATYGKMLYREKPQPQVRDRLGRMAGNSGLTTALRRLGLKNNKHIPDAYLRASARQREELLAGLIDSDGYVEHATGKIEVTSVQERLALQVAELARTLGHRARIYKGVATLNGVEIGPKFRVVWTTRSGGGRLERKQIHGRNSLGQPNRIKSRYVTSIEQVESRPVRCISVEDPSSLFLAGHEFLVTHNSRAGSEWLVQRTLDHPVDASGAPTERLLIAETIADARNICVSGPSGVIRVLERRSIKYRYVKSPKPQIRFLDSGCIIHVEGADDADVGRGYNAADVWLDEMAKWPTPRESWIEGIMPSLRADLPGDHPRAFVTTTPKPLSLLREWATRDDGSIIVVQGHTFDNRANLSPLILQALEKNYAGTTIGEQELAGVLLDAATGKVFSQVDINTARIDPEDLPKLKRIAVGVDPGGTGEEDETGIIVVGQGVDHDLYVLDDCTILGVGREAARHCWRTLTRHSAGKMIVENTLGKKWVTESFTDAYNELRDDEGIFPADSRPPLETVDSKLSKKTRAEPVGMRCEQHRIHFVGRHPKLEAQCVEFDPSDRDSPDRFDAFVSASRWLMKQEPRQASIVTPASMEESKELDRLGGMNGMGALDDIYAQLARW
jgi:phage terminase large subunit-like protein